MSAIYLPEDVRKLLFGKNVVIVGDSVQRSIYKDLVLLIQDRRYLTQKELRKKGEESFLGDDLLEGGVKGEMSNSVNYREVRHYKYEKSNINVKYFFVTIVYGDYTESVIKKNSDADVIIMNSCLWDVHRYGEKGLKNYEDNLKKLVAVVKRECTKAIFLWGTTPPVHLKSKGGFLALPGVDVVKINDVKRCNHIARQVISEIGFHFVDFDHVFGFFLHHRAEDGVHWNEKAHRRMTNMLMEEIARIWNKAVPRPLTEGDEYFHLTPVEDGIIAPPGEFVEPDFIKGIRPGPMPGPRFGPGSGPIRGPFEREAMFRRPRFPFDADGDFRPMHDIPEMEMEFYGERRFPRRIVPEFEEGFGPGPEFIGPEVHEFDREVFEREHFSPRFPAPGPVRWREAVPFPEIDEREAFFRMRQGGPEHMEDFTEDIDLNEPRLRFPDGFRGGPFREEPGFPRGRFPPMNPRFQNNGVHPEPGVSIGMKRKLNENGPSPRGLPPLMPELMNFNAAKRLRHDDHLDNSGKKPGEGIRNKGSPNVEKSKLGVQVRPASLKTPDKGKASSPQVGKASGTPVKSVYEDSKHSSATDTTNAAKDKINTDIIQIEEKPAVESVPPAEQRAEIETTMKDKKVNEGVAGDKVAKDLEKKGMEVPEKKGVEILEKKGVEGSEKKGLESLESKGIKVSEKNTPICEVIKATSEKDTPQMDSKPVKTIADDRKTPAKQNSETSTQVQPKIAPTKPIGNQVPSKEQLQTTTQPTITKSPIAVNLAPNKERRPLLATPNSSISSNRKPSDLVMEQNAANKLNSALDKSKAESSPVDTTTAVKRKRNDNDNSDSKVNVPPSKLMAPPVLPPKKPAAQERTVKASLPSRQFALAPLPKNISPIKPVKVSQPKAPVFTSTENQGASAKHEKEPQKDFETTNKDNNDDATTKVSTFDTVKAEEKFIKEFIAANCVTFKGAGANKTGVKSSQVTEIHRGKESKNALGSSAGESVKSNKITPQEPKVLHAPKLAKPPVAASPRAVTKKEPEGVSAVGKTNQPAASISVTHLKPADEKRKGSISQVKSAFAGEKPGIADEKTGIADEKPAIADEKPAISEDKASIVEERPAIKKAGKPVLKLLPKSKVNRSKEAVNKNESVATTTMNNTGNKIQTVSNMTQHAQGRFDSQGKHVKKHQRSATYTPSMTSVMPRSGQENHFYPQQQLQMHQQPVVPAANQVPQTGYYDQRPYQQPPAGNQFQSMSQSQQHQSVQQHQQGIPSQHQQLQSHHQQLPPQRQQLPSQQTPHPAPSTQQHLPQQTLISVHQSQQQLQSHIQQQQLQQQQQQQQPIQQQQLQQQQQAIQQQQYQQQQQQYYEQLQQAELARRRVEQEKVRQAQLEEHRRQQLLQQQQQQQQLLQLQSAQNNMASSQHLTQQQMELFLKARQELQERQYQQQLLAQQQHLQAQQQLQTQQQLQLQQLHAQQQLQAQQMRAQRHQQLVSMQVSSTTAFTNSYDKYDQRYEYDESSSDSESSSSHEEVRTHKRDERAQRRSRHHHRSKSKSHRSGHGEETSRSRNRDHSKHSSHERTSERKRERDRDKKTHKSHKKDRSRERRRDRSRSEQRKRRRSTISDTQYDDDYYQHLLKRVGGVL